MPKYVEIVVNVPRIAGTFHYHLPPELENTLQLGQLVVVPFGDNNALQQGVVTDFIEHPEVEETKAVHLAVEQGIVLTPQQIEFAKQLSFSTLASLASCIALMLPGGVTKLAATEYQLLNSDATRNNPSEAKIIALLKKRGTLRGRQISNDIPKQQWRPAMQKLIQAKLVSTAPVLPTPSIRPKYIKTAELRVPVHTLPEVFKDIDNKSWQSTTSERRKAALEFLANEKVPVDLNWIEAEVGANRADLKLLHEIELVTLREEEAWRDPLAGLAYDPSIPPQLTADQTNVWEKVEKAITSQKTQKPFLLHGVTGSGKTEIYLRAVDEMIQQGKQAIILVPEIALTPQTVRRFMARFPGQVGIYHSRLSIGEQYDTWRRARLGQLPVIVGPRSALFMPMPNLGLIVVDESHDSSYYQDTGAPYYHARTAALSYAEIANAVCILGTATPDTVSYHAADAGVYQYLHLPNRILAHRETAAQYVRQFPDATSYRPGEGDSSTAELPAVEVVDMRGELRQGNRSIFSQALQTALRDVLDKQQQAILFLNRRGTATYVFCRDCGHSLVCPNCDMPLTYHSHESNNKKGKLICHHCNHREGWPEHCPQCESTRIRQYGMGTERVEAEVLELFPEARTLRWDSETTRKKGTHEIILSHFINHNADILIGTQMLAKGLDLPLVTLVGVILADVGLQLPDYRAGERVFQVLTQVAGRAGRSPLGGKVIYQSFEPEHYIIQHAAKHDYAGFIERETAYRQRLDYPPFTQLLRLVTSDREPAKVQAEAETLAENLKGWIGNQPIDIIGPTPCFYTRLMGETRWQIILRGADPTSVLRDRQLPNWQIEVNPDSLL